MNQSRHFIFFSLHEQRYALRLGVVERVLRIAEISPLPQAPGMVLGMINIQGQVLPVINLRRRLSLPEREIRLSDQLIMAQTSQRSVALVVDGVYGVVERPEDAVIPAKTILAGMEYIRGVMLFRDGVILIHDLDRFLSLEEVNAFDEIMKKT
jgi:purine-binding chemotaxis protein CheW